MDSLDPYPDRPAHWIKHNQTERTPHRWIVADTEGFSRYGSDAEVQSLRCVDAVRWRDDLKTGDHAEWHSGESAEDFWRWCDDYTKSGTRTVLWFHNASYDLRTLDCFRILPALGWDLEWCNLDRDVSVVSWRSDHGTLVVADTFTWTGKGLADIGGMVGIGKPQLPDNDDTLTAWHARCRADVEITRQMVIELLDFVRGEHLGNWQPSGAGMGYTAWRHRFLDHKILVHDDAPALAAERRAMHAGRAEAWWHGEPAGGPFTEWDMHMSYCRIAAECDVPVKLFAFDDKPSKAVHEWARKRWTLLCDVEVTTDVPCVPARVNDRTIWPTGRFTTTLWLPELDMLTAAGGTYKVLRQWRYNMAPALREWAQWSMALCAAADNRATPVQKAFVKHQSRAMIGRLGLRNASWDEFGANPYGWCGITDYLDGDTGETSRMMHIGDKTFIETEPRESRNSLPQITGYIMAVARCRLWEATMAAGQDHVVHVDTDSLICDRFGTKAMRAAVAAGLPGAWRPKDKMHKITVTGPRHYRGGRRRVIPGIPLNATETAPGVFRGEVWESLATALQAQRGDVVRIAQREWRPRQFDGRRPWTGDGPALPVRLPAEDTERNTPHVRPANRTDHTVRPAQRPGQRGKRPANRDDRTIPHRGRAAGDRARDCLPGSGANGAPGAAPPVATVNRGADDATISAVSGKPRRLAARPGRKEHVS